MKDRLGGNDSSSKQALQCLPCNVLKLVKMHFITLMQFLQKYSNCSSFTVKRGEDKLMGSYKQLSDFKQLNGLIYIRISEQTHLVIVSMGTLSHERSNLKELESILAVTVICSFHIDMVNLIPVTFFAVCDKSREQRLSTNNKIL